MRVLVLGGYGLIGQPVVLRLLAEGHAVVGLGRDVVPARRMMPAATWIRADLTRLPTADSWRPHLAGIEAIVNCAGALQDGLHDDVAAVQSRAMIALWEAAAQRGIRRIVQISAPRASPDADTAFMRTKGEADAALVATSLDWIILRPGLVIAPQAYGGTALVRALAAMPLILPLAASGSRMRTVSVAEVAEAAASAVAGRLPTRQTFDLVEDEAHSLADIVRAFRAWQGRPPAPIVNVPGWLARLVFKGGDLLGRLGWRTPVRTTALRELENGIGGDPAPWTKATGAPLRSLSQTLACLPSTVQERWYARVLLVKPIIIGTLALFWLASGLIALVRLEASSALLADAGASAITARGLAVATSLLDMALGAAILVRRTMPAAALGMIATSCVYLVAGTLLAPGLWLDPLGPFVKVLPSITLALAALAIAEER